MQQSRFTSEDVEHMLLTKAAAWLEQSGEAAVERPKDTLRRLIHTALTELANTRVDDELDDEGEG